MLYLIIWILAREAVSSSAQLLASQLASLSHSPASAINPIKLINVYVRSLRVKANEDDGDVEEEELLLAKATALWPPLPKR